MGIIVALIDSTVQRGSGVSPVTVTPRVLPTITGVLNPAVTQANINQTVCVPNWTDTIRPPTSYTQALKKRQLKDLGYGDHNYKHYEEDHFIPLALGGNPTAIGNLWPEPWPQAHNSDPYEAYLHRQLCAGHESLTHAQTLIREFKETNG